MPKVKLAEEKEEWKWSQIRDEQDVIEIIGFDNIYDCSSNDTEDIYEVPIREDIISNYGIVHAVEKQLWEENGEEPTFEEVANELDMTTEQVESIEYIYNDAVFWQPYTRGIIMINGEEGAGKDLLGNSLACRFRNYYGKTPILDSRPTPDFGFCIPYSMEFLVDQVKRINHIVGSHSSALATGHGWNDPEMGKIFLKGSTMLFSEFGNIMHRMKQTSPKSRIMASILKQWRHIEYCMICCDADERAVDPNYFLPRVTCRIHAIQSYKEDHFIYHFYPVKSITKTSALNIPGKIQKLYLVGNEPHPGLNGKCPYDIYHTKNAQGIDIPKSLLKGENK